jgi:PelA/Pel-15E family pectate lyase
MLQVVTALLTDLPKRKCILTTVLSRIRWCTVPFAMAACLSLSAVLAHAKSGTGAYLKNSDQWFAGDDARRIAESILSYQSTLGGWPKNTDTTRKPLSGDRQKRVAPTFDNHATTDELRFLARAYDATKSEAYRQAFEKGYDYILKAQYPNGGWPQFYPPPASYHRHITFNDDSMVRLMDFLRETCKSSVYAFLDDSRKQAAREAFNRGVTCILKCQIKVDGKPTAWCAQHDESDFTPQTGRKYELPSLSGAESVGIVRLLMSLDDPSPEVVRAVEGAAAWFESAKLKGMRVSRERDEKAPKGTNKVIVPDPAAPPLWARFYEIGTNRPLFVDRDGIPRYNLADIGYERRNGYGWLGSWPESLLDQDYPAWRKKWADRVRPA